MTDIEAVIEKLERVKAQLNDERQSAENVRDSNDITDIGYRSAEAQAARLRGKIEGIRLALSYLREEAQQ